MVPHRIRASLVTYIQFLVVHAFQNTTSCCRFRIPAITCAHVLILAQMRIVAMPSPHIWWRGFDKDSDDDVSSKSSSTNSNGQLGKWAHCGLRYWGKHSLHQALSLYTWMPVSETGVSSFRVCHACVKKWPLCRVCGSKLRFLTFLLGMTAISIMSTIHHYL